MRVLFLTLYPETAASSRYRVNQFLPGLRALGVECTAAAPLSVADWTRYSGAGRKHRPFWYHFYETSTRFRQLFSVGRYDVVVLQKAITTASVRGLDSLLYSLAKRVIYDIDDAVHLSLPQPLPGRYRWLSDGKQISGLMARADRVLAGNRWLVEEAAAAGGRAEYFPTVVDTARFVPPAGAPAAYTLGWMGSPGTAPSLRLLTKVTPFPADLRIKVVGAGPGGVDLPAVTCEPWHYDTEVEAVQQMSVGLMPLDPSAWTRGKCALKALLYMACGLPVIATPFGAVCDIVRNGENGILADTPEAWGQAIEMLRDPVRRQSLGDAARATVESDFSLAKAVPRYASILDGLC